MYEVYRNSLERLNFKASHDELTGAYNRSGYELLLSSVDLGSVYMLLFDLDNFKEINDTYGHEVGDKVLIKLVNILKLNFRSDDYVCRIGGDEFVAIVSGTNCEEVCQNIIEKELNLTRSTISGVLQTMEKHQIIERKKSKLDTRTKTISLSNKSEEKYLEGKNKLIKLEKKARKNLTQSEINDFIRIINKIKESIND